MTMIAIEGVIGVGKTTLARYLNDILKSSLVLEVFEENPFLSLFYQDRERYAFQTQMFFLLSRYQQMRELAELPHPVVSDYMFQKDYLFASLTLRGNEMMMYERVYSALLENTPPPDLIVYLRTDTPTLMQRIAFRDRPYERNMDEAYIDALRQRYEYFFANYDSERHLVIDTTHLDIVHNLDDRWHVIQRVLGRLGEMPHQPNLPGLYPAPLIPLEISTVERTLPEDTFPNSDLLMNLMEVQEGLGEMSKHLRQGKPTPQPVVANMLKAVMGMGKAAGIQWRVSDFAQLVEERGESA